MLIARALARSMDSSFVLSTNPSASLVTPRRRGFSNVTVGKVSVLGVLSRVMTSAVHSCDDDAYHSR